MCVVFIHLYPGCCFYIIVPFWSTRSIILPDQGSIYVGGFSTFWRLNAMFFRSLGSELICSCTICWDLIAICSIYMLIFHISLLNVLILCSKQDCSMYHFFLFYYIKPLHIFWFVFLFLFLHYVRLFVTFCYWRYFIYHLLWSQWSKCPPPYVPLYWW